jgi:ectoine hydroxylase-related dioxygenase (phytanoyl-CoA dioxygenase family)
LNAWLVDGWVHLPAVYNAEEVSAINDVVDVVWMRKPRCVTADDVDTSRRVSMSSLTNEARSHRIKIGDLYLHYAQLRQILLKATVTRFLSSLLGDEPVLCNSLNMEHGSAQEFHADSLFMTPQTPGGVIACWIALEDVKPGSGPLRLYRGSHLIPPYRFANGQLHAVTEELQRWGDYMQSQLDALGLSPENVYAKAGDVVVWHADTVHGAEPIADHSLTRRSLVGHYYRLSDARVRGYKLEKAAAGLWIKRRPQPVNSVTRILCSLERRVQDLRALLYRARKWS